MAPAFRITHPWAALAGIGAFLLFALAIATFYGYLDPATVGGFSSSAWVVFGVLDLFAAIGAYIIEEGTAR